MSKKLTNRNRLSVIFPEIVKEWDYERNYPLTPHDVSYGCHKKVFWRCKKGHTWSVNVNARTNPNKRGTKNKKRTKKVNGCPYCSGRYVTKETCLAAVNPKLIREWHPTKNGKLTPYDVMPSSCEKVWWVCENKNHTWRSSISSRSAGAGCPYCSGHRMVKEKSLAAMRPELIKEWHPTKNGKLTPYNTSYGSRSAVFWKCIKRGHIWSASVKTRSRGHGCPCCRGLYIKDGVYLRSFVEAYFYLKFKRQRVKFSFDKTYPRKYGKYHRNMRRRRYDFYLPKTNTYIEVTSFTLKHSISQKAYRRYMAKIKEKKYYVENVLGARFKFLQKRLGTKEKNFVLKYVV